MAKKDKTEIVENKTLVEEKIEIKPEIFKPVYAEIRNNNKQENKPVEQKQPERKQFIRNDNNSYLMGYNHKEVEIKLINNEELQGKLHAGKDTFNVQLENVVTHDRTLIPKHSILYLHEKWK